MMEQFTQQEQVSSPQMVQQQMMLAPVRYIYETPMMMQPGNQMQQHQTILINTQNPPPWIRPIQNQVIYVQHIPNMAPMQQNVDPNLYIQQHYLNYPSIMPQIYNHNPQDQIRYPIQAPSVMPQNIMLNVPLNPNSTIQNVQDERGIRFVQNCEQAPSNTDANAQNTAPLINIVKKEHIVNNTQNVIQNLSQNVVNMSQMVNNIEKKQDFKPIGQVVLKPQIINQTPNQNTQNVTMNVSNIPQTVQNARHNVPNVAHNNHNVGNNVQNVSQIVQNIGHNIQNVRQNMPMQTQNVMNVIQNQTGFLNSMPRLQGAVESQVNPGEINNRATVSYTAVRNGQAYTYRAIQPRPQYMIANFNNTPNNVNNNTNKTIVEVLNRKRKSESPDEIRKKIPANSAVAGNANVTIKTEDYYVVSTPSSNEVGVNTSPVRQRPIQTAVVQNKPIAVQNKSNEVKQVNDSLKRVTVFTQARGRVLNDKEIQTNTREPVVNKADDINKCPITIEKIEMPNKVQIKQEKLENDQVTERNESIEINKKPEGPDEIPIKFDISAKTDETNVKVKETAAPNEKSVKTNENVAVGNEKSVKSNNIIKIEAPIKNINEGITISNENPTETKETVATDECILKVSNIATQTKKDVVPVKSKQTIKESDSKIDEKCSKMPNDLRQVRKNKKEYTNLSINDMKGTEIHIVDGSIVKEDKDYVLTHVLDGYVIQESNVPFAVRKPLIEKVIPPNIPIEQKLESLNARDTNVQEKDCIVKDDTTKPKGNLPDLCNLNINEEKQMEIENQISNKEVKENDNPFGRLKPAVVKSWSVDDLCSHLSKYNWEETVLLLQEHEIDGESLFLASKSQLLTIGVSETHADIISEFVKS